MNAIIVEDEPLVAQCLKAMLIEYCPEVEVLTMVDSVQDALRVIPNRSVDLLFIDITLKDGTGFDILDLTSACNFQSIFITAFEDQAIRALRAGATDYLVKPLDFRELIAAVQKAQEKQAPRPPEEAQSILLAEMKKMHQVPFEKIQYLHAAGSYTTVVLGDEEIVTSRKLGEYDNALKSSDFFRCHHSYVVNLANVRKVDRHSNLIILTSGKEIPVSVRRREELRTRLMERNTTFGKSSPASMYSLGK